jgi:SAM-dependent methyltransferase
MLPELKDLWRKRVRKPMKRAFARMNSAWRRDGDFSVRTYKSYEHYRRHQASKLSGISTRDLSNYDVTFRRDLGDRLQRLPWIRPGLSVLCLAARIGTECKAFIDRGCFAVGIDLNPGTENNYVVQGDFHHLQYADSSVDCVYTNSLDHAFDLQRIVQEVERVLKPRGVFIAEIVEGAGDATQRMPGPFEALWWEKLESVADRIAACGFEVEHREPFQKPWSGEQFVYRSRKAA